MCDITLEAQGRQIHAHKAMLALASPYFHVMFTSDFKEKNEKVITLHDVTYEGLAGVIDLIYDPVSKPVYRHEKAKITDSNVGDVLGAASLLQIPIIISICERHLEENMHASTWCQFRALGDKYGLKRVVDRADQLFLMHFVDIIKTPGFSDVSKEYLIRYLSANALSVRGNELHVFKAAYEWISADIQRAQHTEEIMQHVRFMLINSAHLDRLVDLPIIKEEKTCQELIQNASQYQLDVYKQPLITCQQNMP